MTKTKMEL